MKCLHLVNINAVDGCVYVSVFEELEWETDSRNFLLQHQYLTGRQSELQELVALTLPGASIAATGAPPHRLCIHKQFYLASLLCFQLFILILCVTIRPEMIHRINHD